MPIKLGKPVVQQVAFDHLCIVAVRVTFGIVYDAYFVSGT